MQAISPVAAETFVAAVAGKSDRDMLTRELTHTIGRDRRAVSEGFVVKTREVVDKIEILAFYPVHVVSCVVPLGDEQRVP